MRGPYEFVPAFERNLCFRVVGPRSGGMYYLDRVGYYAAAEMTKITTKGQMTIPKRLRDHLGLKPGSSVEFELAADGRVFLKTPQ